MSDSNSRFLGRKYSCPGCQSSLRFRRPPRSLLQTCPNCRRKLRLQEAEAEASKDDLVREAIESLINWKSDESRPYDYRTDPRLDRATECSAGVWVFDQPWPEHVGDVIYQEAEVVFNPRDLEATTVSRNCLFNGKYRRVSIYRTGEVEQMAVNGHWWDIEPHEQKVGLLSRAVVRELNRHTKAKKFAARINRMAVVPIEEQEFIELSIDIAVESSTRERQTRILR